MNDSSALRPSPRPGSGNALAVTDADADDADGALPDRYDPADYRWVPVRRVPRFDGWTEEKQRRFIETLADTGLVGAAAKAVGMSRQSAYQLRRAGHGAAFARAWDAARHHAGALIEDIAFERAIEGVEHEVYNDCGEVIGAKLVHDSRLLRYLLSHLKPERYGTRNGAPAPAPAAPVPAEFPSAAPASALDAAAPPVAPAPTLADGLRALEPVLPAPVEDLLTPDELADALALADAADGTLPQFLCEQHPPLSAAQIAARAAAARHARGAAALAKRDAGLTLSDEEFADECFHLDPLGNARRRRRSR